MWYETEYSIMPEELDTISSSKFVYIRKDIEAMEKEELKLKNDNKLYSIELAKKEFLAKSNAEETERAAR